MPTNSAATTGTRRIPFPDRGPPPSARSSTSATISPSSAPPPSCLAAPAKMPVSRRRGSAPNGALALLLAAVGLYSVIAYNVAQRRQELAVRVALGAATGNVMRLVVGEGLRFAVSGAVLGGALALLAGRWVAPLLLAQSRRDPVVFGTVTGALLLVALVATAIPAIRGARVDPNTALRAE